MGVRGWLKDPVVFDGLSFMIDTCRREDKPAPSTGAHPYLMCPSKTTGSSR